MIGVQFTSVFIMLYLFAADVKKMSVRPVPDGIKCL
jgi:hypothetical protein